MSDINNNETDEMDIEMIDITYEDGTSCTCEIIAKFEVNDISYAALLPADDEDADIIVVNKPVGMVVHPASRETMSPSTRSPTRLSSTMSQTPSTRFWTIWNSIQMTRNNIRTSMRFL